MTNRLQIFTRQGRSALSSGLGVLNHDTRGRFHPELSSVNGSSVLAGVSLVSDGMLRLVAIGDPWNAIATVAWSGTGGAAFSTNNYYTLQYTLDTTTGNLSNISLSGSNANFSALTGHSIKGTDPQHFADYLAIGGDFNTADIGSGGSGINGNVKNLSLSSTIPEPSAYALLGLGTVGMVARRRRTA